MFMSAVGDDQIQRCLSEAVTRTSRGSVGARDAPLSCESSPTQTGKTNFVLAALVLRFSICQTVVIGGSADSDTEPFIRGLHGFRRPERLSGGEVGHSHLVAEERQANLVCWACPVFRDVDFDEALIR